MTDTRTPEPADAAPRPTGRRQGIALAALSALLMLLAFPPVGLFWLAWIGLVPLLLSLRGAGPGRAVLHGLVFGLVLYGLALHRLLGAEGGGGLQAIGQLMLAAVLFGLARCAVPENWGPAAGGVLLAGAWVGLEFVRVEWLPGGTPWMPLGLSQVGDGPLLQFAAVLGVYSLSFLVLLANIAIADVIGRRSKDGGITLIAVALAIGLLHLAGMERRIEPDATKVVVIVQQHTADVAEAVAVSESTADVPPDLVLWPEGALPQPVHEGAPAIENLGAASAFAMTTLVVPADYVAEGASESELSALVFGRDGAFLGAYGEPDVVPLMGRYGGAEAGLAVTHMGYLGILFGPEIYGSLLPMAKVAGRGEFLLVCQSGALERGSGLQALAEATIRVRAVETGRFVIRANAGGHSLIVDPMGREVLRAGTDPGWVVGTADTRREWVSYVLWGRWFGPACLGVAALVLLIGLARAAVPGWRRAT